MTIEQAETILDIVSAALQDDSHPFGQHPVSSLHGHDLSTILIALKLRIANEFLQLAHQSDFERQFAEGLQLYDSIPWQIMRSFVADDEVGTIGARLVLSPIDPSNMKFADQRVASMETGSSFGDFCRSIGPRDPNYWQRVYERIELEYTFKSPRGNAPVL